MNIGGWARGRCRRNVQWWAWRCRWSRCSRCLRCEGRRRPWTGCALLRLNPGRRGGSALWKDLLGGKIVGEVVEQAERAVVVLVDADDRGAACSGGPCWCRSWRQRDVVLEQAVEIHGQQHRWHRRSRRTRRRAASARARRWRARLPQLRHERRESRARAARTARTSSWRLWFVVHAPATTPTSKSQSAFPSSQAKLVLKRAALSKAGLSLPSLLLLNSLPFSPSADVALCYYADGEGKLHGTTRSRSLFVRFRSVFFRSNAVLFLSFACVLSPKPAPRPSHVFRPKKSEASRSSVPAPSVFEKVALKLAWGSPRQDRYGDPHNVEGQKRVEVEGED